MFQTLNTAVSFLLELVMLAAFAIWGFYGEKSLSLKWLLGIGLPLLTAILWGVFFAPRSAYRLKGMAYILLSLILFLLGAVALFYSEHPILAIVFAVIAVINRLLIVVWKQS
jgi:hypothetical protein